MEPVYVKVIGRNRGKFPYHLGLNRLADNDDEPFDPRPDCGPGGLYYCNVKDVLDWLGYGGTRSSCPMCRPSSST